MPKNIEIKAKIPSKQKIENYHKLLTQSCGQAEIIHQHDTFFNSKKGRLKLREFFGDERKKKEPELIFYERNDENGPKMSDFIQIRLGDKSEGIKDILSLAYGVKGCVIKKRTLYIYQTQTRVHIDEVENLGDFIEIEVCLRDDQTENDGKEILINLSKYLDISNEDLIKGAYLDLLEK
ncbi:hypothetical protein ACQ4LE_001257 [Meloidogyne hapla]|uniref:CYTH domain-containing protein n=1 Tax=Meloidogyne hapla TaxID=6305 RepID=A0A1I8B8Q9_MELHA